MSGIILEILMQYDNTSFYFYHKEMSDERAKMKLPN